MDIPSDEKSKMKYLSFPEPPCHVYFMFNGKQVELDKPCVRNKFQLWANDLSNNYSLASQNIITRNNYLEKIIILIS